MTGLRSVLAATAIGAIAWASAGRCQAAAPLSPAERDRLSAAVEAPGARDAISRVAYAEAGNQGDSGLAGVVYAILNRVARGSWGGSVEAVVDAPHQFEPVMRVGGDWRSLRAVTAAERARVDTILNLALDGRLPDPTGGALYFQNPKIVAARAATGSVPARLVNFGGSRPTAVIGDHAFYRGDGGGGRRASARAAGSAAILMSGGGIVPDHGGPADETPQATDSDSVRTSRSTTAGVRGVFVLSDGQIVEDQP